MVASDNTASRSIASKENIERLLSKDFVPVAGFWFYSLACWPILSVNIALIKQHYDYFVGVGRLGRRHVNHRDGIS